MRARLLLGAALVLALALGVEGKHRPPPPPPPCDPACQNGGTCHNGRCRCAAGWSGDDCSACGNAPNGCQHGGTCSNHRRGQTSCRCTAGWSGDNCSKLAACGLRAAKGCLHGGTCSGGILSQTCSCVHGWSGGDCSADGPCSAVADPCEHGGTAVPVDADCTCTCGDGWNGPHCGASDACSSSPCVNGGTCADLVVNGDPVFQCSCDNMHLGDTCSETDACHSTPCQNSGTCDPQNTDGKLKFTCKCVYGWDGALCQTNVQAECDSGPCGDHGDCAPNHRTVTNPEAYRCTCKDDYTGVSCQVAPSACDSSPCWNDGNCADADDGTFTCQCASCFSGPTCEVKTGEACYDDGSFTDEQHYPCSAWGARVRSGVAADGWDCWGDDDAAKDWGYSGAAALDAIRDHCPKACGFCGSACVTMVDGHERPYRDLDNVTDGRWDYNADRTQATLVCLDRLAISVGDGKVQTCGSGGWSGPHGVAKCEQLCIRGHLPHPDHARSNSNGGAWAFTDPDPPADVNYISPGATAQLYCDNATGWTPEEVTQLQTCSDDSGKWTPFDDSPPGTPECDKDPYAPCLSLPCQHGGTCIGHVTNGQATFECRCAAHYTGDMCETEIQPCDSNPCSGANGDCTNTHADSFTCTCHKGWSGDRCQQPASCEPNPCQAGGHCVDGNSTHYACRCVGPHYGTNCEKRSLCTSRSGHCQNGGVCVDCAKQDFDHGQRCWYGEDTECRCPYEYVGDECEVPPACGSDTCQHGGTCINSWGEIDGVRSGVPGFNCTCKAPWSGGDCTDCTGDAKTCLAAAGKEAANEIAKDPEELTLSALVIVMIVAMLMFCCCRNKDAIGDNMDKIMYSTRFFGEGNRPEHELMERAVDERWHQARAAQSMEDFEDVDGSIGLERGVSNPVASPGGGRKMKRAHSRGVAQMFRDVNVNELRPNAWREQVIGKGSYGKVYRATWKGQDVAVKSVMMPEAPLDGSSRAATDEFQRKLQEVRDDFVKEVEICCDLAHPNLVSLLGYSTRAPKGPEEWLIVQELMTGQSLDKQLYTERWQPNKAAIKKIAIDVAKGMHYLHEETQFQLPIIHRDLKSPNLLLATAPPPEGEEHRIVVKIADFGLSTEKLVDEEATQTMLMTGCGSVLWMAPEILMGSVYNEKVDVFSYAMCLVELVDWHLPWHGCANTPEVAVKCTRGERPDRQLRSADPQMKELIEQCWHNEPQRRLTFAQVLTNLGVTPERQSHFNGLG